MFCSECGNIIESGSKFCSKCGRQIEQESMQTSQKEFAGKIVKCPNCGEVLNAFVAVCPSCGYELRGANIVSAVKELELELKRIEAEPRSFGINTRKVTDQKLSEMISNFSVPNTQEDIFEFMILAASNIDPMAYQRGSRGYPNEIRQGRMLVSNSWESKYNQAYQKAKLMFPNDIRLAEIEDLYLEKQKQIKKAKIGKWAIVKGILIFYAIAFIFSFVFLGTELYREARKEDQLEAKVIEIENDIANGDYDSALIKANSLRVDSDLSHSKQKKWDQQREDIIRLINEKKNEEQSKSAR